MMAQCTAIAVGALLSGLPEGRKQDPAVNDELHDRARRVPKRPASNYDETAAAKYRAERAARKAANFAKRNG